ncbi:Hypothetical Protein FCC1311_055902 [Hondaea fermentalgiana]|uniref:Phosphoribosylanthranilate isomerase n=1 Tax=Hondaea fermentalgiana TaxID=2315210 RepID=A0A2R5GI16_9STRA|nr:Hypothetical Protein FCC1311_055902 [Hondaea fermentalgiana]|eukprot:GBG29368.1 Hypothetical Protein FCC1311_055902 [Hondaea fermentalgiana]
MSASEDGPSAAKVARHGEACLPLLRVGFCGVDESVAPEDVVEISRERAPWAEWGVLFRPEKEGQPRFPSMKWVEDSLCKVVCKANHQTGVPTVLLAAHLCSSRCEQVLNGDVSFVERLFALGFRRVQVNATKANNVDSSNLAAQVDNVTKCIAALPAMEWILQRNEETRALWEPLLARKDTLFNMSVLFDDSVGTGVERTTFPRPDVAEGLPCGYAGGIGPHNISKVLAGIASSAIDDFTDSSASHRAPWIDMESSLREKNADGQDIFSLARCRQCIDQVDAECKSGAVKVLVHSFTASV